MRAFFRTSSGEANEAASRVAHAVASNASSSVEQPVEAFVSIEAVNRWLKSRGELPSSSDFERLRAAVVVLTSKPKPRQEDVRPLCVSWNVRLLEHKKFRPLATLIKELQQAVFAECSKLRGSLDVQPGASATSDVQPGASATSAVQHLSKLAHPAPIKTLVDLRHWVEHLHEADRRTSPVCRVRDALRVLELDPSRDARKHLQALLKSWDIKQKEPSGKKRIASGVHHRLVTSVLLEGNRLRTLGRSVGSFSSRATFEEMCRNSSEQRDADISRRGRSRSPQL
jgi:hypothetical protein